MLMRLRVKLTASGDSNGRLDSCRPHLRTSQGCQRSRRQVDGVSRPRYRFRAESAVCAARTLLTRTRRLIVSQGMACAHDSPSSQTGPPPPTTIEDCTSPRSRSSSSCGSRERRWMSSVAALAADKTRMVHNIPTLALLEYCPVTSIPPKVHVKSFTDFTRLLGQSGPPACENSSSGTG